MSADRAIRTPVTAELQWQQRLARLRPPQLDFEHWLPRRARLVVVAPHPDDEVLACGGLVQMHARRGGEVRVIGVTDGEASHPEASTPFRARLAARRRAERSHGLAVLGVAPDRVTSLALADGGVSTQARALAAMLQSLLHADDVVVSTWRHDGHPDHDATGAAAACACASVGCRFVEAPVWMWHWATQNDPRVEWRRLRALHLDPPAHRSKLAAIAAHTSQLEARGAALAPVLDAAILERAARDCEYFFEAATP